ncbi:hypothetical protein SAMN02745134_02923 [Clostridium acidisoli DSM 12555]|uniref:Uncharacterized protein n=1 Tax=Clostridium acidisoli DSM 12555 TaxID=1121291 RepID=A0A1W1XSA7_9CLOT|nr:hypothetical protein [Clostridium acidisoli]SMC26744.1 hypothetical protein SAMN02745134_02923 [Clostridium acidisoli DSM 12555]
MKKVKYMGIAGVIIGMIFSKILGSYFGNDVRIILMSFSIVCVISVILYLVLNKSYKVAIMFFLMLIPLIIGFLGIYFHNIYLVFGGLILFFIISIILLQYLKKLKR